MEHKFSQGNSEKIKDGMLGIISEGQKFIKSVVTRDQATAMMESKNQSIKHRYTSGREYALMIFH
jgi:hypothetical protein